MEVSRALRKMPERRKGSPMLEILAIDLAGAYKAPIPEALAFLYAFFPLLFSFAAFMTFAMHTISDEARLLTVMSLSQRVLSLITIGLILKNVSYGLANELRKGLIQTYMTYPIGRGRLLFVKLLTGVLVPIGYVAFSVLLFTAINMPDLAAEHPHVLALGLLAMVGELLFMASLLFITAIMVKRGGISLAAGIALIFIIQIISAFLLIGAALTRDVAYLHAMYVLDPFAALLDHYQGGRALPWATDTWRPAFWDCVGYLIAHYAILIAIFTAAFVYFIRRFEPT